MVYAAAVHPPRPKGQWVRSNTLTKAQRAVGELQEAKF